MQGMGKAQAVEEGEHQVTSGLEYLGRKLSLNLLKLGSP